MAPSLPIPESWMKRPCQTRHPHVSEGETNIGIQDVEQTLVSKVGDQEGAPARPLCKIDSLDKSFIEQLEQALEHKKN